MSKKNMKKAAIDQIILWIVLFIIFVTFLFFVIDYSNAIKVKDNTDSVADFMARKISLDNDNTDIASLLNNVKGPYFQDIQDADISCTKSTTIENYQVQVNIYTTLVNGFLPTGSDNVHSRVVVFNEDDKFQVICNLTLSFK
mgnify:CR=1 FL=1